MESVASSQLSNSDIQSSSSSSSLDNDLLMEIDARDVEEINTDIRSGQKLNKTTIDDQSDKDSYLSDPEDGLSPTIK